MKFIQTQFVLLFWIFSYQANLDFINLIEESARIHLIIERGNIGYVL